MKRLLWAKVLALSLVNLIPGPVSAQPVLPTDIDMGAARQRMGEALRGVGRPATPSGETVPPINSLPKPAAKSPDIAQMAESYRRPAPPASNGKLSDAPELMVFISFALPKETLQRIVLQSEKSGAVLVLRGLKGNSLTKMGEEIATLVGKRNVTALIHPPAFKLFNVTRVPSLVLSRSSQVSRPSADGCAPAGSFVKVDGDVTQDYALDLIERQAPEWAMSAQSYASRLAGKQP